MTNDLNLRWFKPSEFRGAFERMDPVLLRMLDATRGFSGRPIVITNAFREGEGTAHALGKAVDISDNGRGAPIGSRWRFLVVKAALAAGFTRVGVYDRHIHLDVASEDEGYPAEVIWTGTSR
jgi:hypothetical protein